MRYEWIPGIVHGTEGAKELRSESALTGVVLNTLQVFVRAFDLDERLVGVAFMDVGVYVTALRCLKNLLLISDAVKSVWFVAFQVRWVLISDAVSLTAYYVIRRTHSSLSSCPRIWRPCGCSVPSFFLRRTTCSSFRRI